MSKSIKALVTIKYQWVRNAGLDQLLSILADNKNASLSGMLILPVTSARRVPSALRCPQVNRPPHL